MAKSSRRREVASQAVRGRGVSIWVACAALGVSETCYWYRPKHSEENARIPEWLSRLTHKPRKRLLSKNPRALAVSEAINEVRSMTSCMIS